jgi:tRNA(fMet)-specific endonuclease VapC
MRYVLDTDICSFAIMGNREVFTRLDDLDRDDWAISSLVYAELHYGLVKGHLQPRSEKALQKFLSAAPVVAFDADAAKEAASVRRELELQGKPSGAIDQLLAGQARMLNATFVTANTKHFDRVPGLRVENWTVDSR